jgi:hypothetical protein
MSANSSRLTGDKESMTAKDYRFEAFVREWMNAPPYQRGEILDRYYPKKKRAEANP